MKRVEHLRSSLSYIWIAHYITPLVILLGVTLSILLAALSHNTGSDMELGSGLALILVTHLFFYLIIINQRSQLADY